MPPSNNDSDDASVASGSGGGGGGVGAAAAALAALGGTGGGGGGTGNGIGATGGTPGGVTFPAGLGSYNTPMYIQNLPTPKTVSVTPYGNFLDLSKKDKVFREMVRADDDHTALDMNVTNSKAIVKLFQDKAITYCWMRYMRIPTTGTGATGNVPGTTPGGRPIYMANLGDFKNLIEDFNHLTMDQVMAFTSWFMGDIGQALAVRPANDMKMKWLDVNAPGNDGLVSCFKQECRTVSYVLWHTIKNHLSPASYKSLLVRKKDFAYECTETGDVYYDGYTLLRMIYTVVKPDVIVDIKDLQNKMEKMTILSAGNDFHKLSTSMEELQQEINAEKGEDFLKDDKLLSELFRAAEATTNEAFSLFVRIAKTNWITGKIRDKHVIVNDLNVIYRNMVAEGSWKNVSSADSKIIALTTELKQLKKKYAESKGTSKPAGKSSGKAGQSKKEEGKNWRYTKVGETTTCPETGATLKWCPHHGKGAYMPSDHNHAEWVEKKNKRQAEYEEKRAAKRVKFSSGSSSANTTAAKPVKEEKHPSKLQLSTSLRQSLVTHCSMTPSEADELVNQAFQGDEKDGELKE